MLWEVGRWVVDFRTRTATKRGPIMSKVKTYKYGAADEPTFPQHFDIAKKAVLQVTDIKTNRNKYYAIELHKGNGGKLFRVFTHYGRTDDLETNPNAGQKECRYFGSEAEAEVNYQSIYKEKTSARKGYKEISLASSKIGSQQARGTSSGDVDAKTIQKISTPENAGKKKAVPVSTLEAGVQELVRYIYDEATNALTTTVAAKITANGIETPLGVLTVGQIEKGEKILEELYHLFQKGKVNHDETERLSGEFYTTIPHRIGRTRAAVQAAVIDSLEEFQQKQETLQLMKDMLDVNGDPSVLYDAGVEGKYKALGCEIAMLDSKSSQYQELADMVVKSQIKSKNVKPLNIFSLKRAGEWDNFAKNIGNQRHLLHGSRIKNWVGILSRGILLPKIVVSMGVTRTDAGWLGNGIYFGDAACTSAYYTSEGRKKTRFMALARVALGKMKDYTKITYGITEPPAGYDSCHGVRNRPGVSSQFADDEYVIYTSNQQRLEYLVEFKMLHGTENVMSVKVYLVDINTKMIQAWKDTFEENPEVTIVQGSMTNQQVDAWVSPTNSHGRMDGGLDMVIKRNLGNAIESAVQAQIKQKYNGNMPVGYSTCVVSKSANPKYLISTPTMSSSSEDISDTLNVALACAAAFQAVHDQNALLAGSITSVALPGLGANTGKVPVEICADLMWTAYHLFREKSFTNYQEMRDALEKELGDLGPTTGSKKKAVKHTVNPVQTSHTPTAAVPQAAPKAAAPPVAPDDDFDDTE
jgi:poly [ADP-ribose] polymerase 2/3/4